MEEELNPKTLKTSTEMNLSPPWLDLPDPITELILEKLPLPDYLRFAAACQKWRSIQRNHRFRYSPSQPPMFPPLPWLIPVYHGQDSHLRCCSPFNQSFYRLQQILTTSDRCVFSSHGWILIVVDFDDVDVDEHTFLLVNPITAVKIHLPALSLTARCLFAGSFAMSAPPSDPSCTVLFNRDDDAFLYRVKGADDFWTHFKLPLPTQIPEVGAWESTTVFSGDRFYYIMEPDLFFVIDTVLPRPSVRAFVMDCSQIPQEETANFLVEFDGEVLLVVMLVDAHLLDDDVSLFQVFRPDFSEKMWVRVDRLRDRALFIHCSCCFSLSAADVGCKKNCIYYPSSLQSTNFARGSLMPGVLFTVYDLETGMWIAERPRQDAGAEVETGMWFPYDRILKKVSISRSSISVHCTT